MNTLVRILLSLCTFGISEFFFSTPLPNRPRQWIAVLSLGFSEIAFRKNVKFFVVYISIFAVLGFVGGAGKIQSEVGSTNS